MTDYRRYLNLSTIFLLSSIFFFVPLLLHPKTSEVFEFNKMMFTYITVLLALGVAASKHVLYRTRPSLNFPLRWFWLLFLVSQILTTVFSIDPHTSIWGFYSRFHGGLASTLAYFAIYYLIFDTFRDLPAKSDHKDKLGPLYHQSGFLNTLITSIVSSSILVAAYAVLEHFGIDKNLWVQDVQNRVFSTLGQPNWLSAYLVALLPLSLISLLTSKKLKYNLAWGAYALLLYFSILFTKSRSGIGATFIIIALTLLAQIALSLTKLKSKTPPAKSAALILTGLVTLALVTLIVGSPFTAKISQFQPNTPLVADIATQLNPPAPAKLVGGSDSMQIRKIVWSGALELFRRRPLLGSGLETFGYSYYWVRPTDHNLLSEWDFLYNKAHNEYINFLATTGLIGTSAYMLLIFASLILLLKSSRHELGLSLLLGYISILITNYFGFSVVPIALLFYTFPLLAHLNTQVGKSTPEPSAKPNLSTANTLLLCATALTSLGLATVIIIRWQADINYNQGKSLSSYRYIVQGLPYLEKAVAAYPQEPTYRAQLAETQAQIAAAFDEQIKTSTNSSKIQRDTAQRQLDQLIKSAKENIQLAYNQNPYHLNLLKTKAKVEINLAFIDRKYYSDALNTLIRANELAPTDPKIAYNIGLIYDYLGQPDQAAFAFKKALDLKPNYDQVRVAYITLLQKLNQTDAAKEQIRLLVADYPEYAQQYQQLLN